MWTCENIESLKSGDSLWMEWQNLLGRVPAGFRLFTPEWYVAWQQTWGACGRWTGALHVLAVRDEQRKLQGILALGRPKVGPAKVHSFGGYDQPLRTIVAAKGSESDVGRAIGCYLAESRYNLVQLGPTLRSFQAQGAVIETLREKKIFLRAIHSAPEAICDAPATWDEYEKEVLGGKFKRKINYYERRTERAGEVNIEHHRQPTPAETKQLLDDLATIESRSWMISRENAKPRFMPLESQQMWAQLIEQALAPRDQFDCWLMRIDGVPVSYCLTLSDSPVRYVIANNYDEAVKEHRTGSTLYKYMMRDGIERGLRRFDFGDGEIHYKRYWGAEYTDTRDTFVACPNYFVGKAARTALMVRGFVKNSMNLWSSSRKAENGKEEAKTMDQHAAETQEATIESTQA